MKVRVKIDGKYQEVHVSDRDCPQRPCFGYHHYQHRGSTGTANGTKCSGTDGYLSCPHRNYHGCPQPKPEPEKPDRKKVVA